jgi:hypothetical protein
LHQKIYEVNVIGYCKTWYSAQPASSSAAYGVEKRTQSVPGEYARSELPAPCACAYGAPPRASDEARAAACPPRLCG